MGLHDRVYIVTGGGGAIAQPILSAFAGAGARLVAADRTLEIAQRAAQGHPLAVDLSRPEGAAEMVAATREKFGRLDGLIHTVGGFASGKAHEGDPPLYDKMLDLNLRTLWHALRAVVPVLLERGDGFIAGFASEPAWTGAAPGTALYGAAKAAVAHLLHSLDAELRGSGVRVSVVYPMGAVDTPANRRDMPDFDPARYIDPADIAEALLFAATRSPRARALELPHLAQMSLSDDSALSPGDRIDQWVIQEKLGEGGFATVYQARHADTGQKVALKLLNAEAALDKNVLRRFLREAETSIDHPNIVQVLGFGDHARQPFIVLELLSGENLADRVKKKGRVPPDEAIAILVEVTLALARAHDQDIIHRDLKPENLFLTGSTVKVLDFGIAKVPHKGELKTATRAIIGTLHTMSPEQCRSSNIDARSDIYSLGVVAWFMLAGDYPFAHAHDLEIAVAHLKEQPPPLRDKTPEVPAALAEIVHRCLEKDPKARYQTMRQLRDALLLIAAPERRSRRRVWMMTFIAFLVLGAAAWFYLQ